MHPSTITLNTIIFSLTLRRKQLKNYPKIFQSKLSVKSDIAYVTKPFFHFYIGILELRNKKENYRSPCK